MNEFLEIAVSKFKKKNIWAALKVVDEWFPSKIWFLDSTP